MSPHILALDVSGAPHRWIDVRDAAHYYATDMIAWAAGTSEFVLRGGTQRATGMAEQRLRLPLGKNSDVRTRVHRHRGLGRRFSCLRLWFQPRWHASALLLRVPREDVTFTSTAM